MNLAMVATSVLVGLIAAWLAGRLIKDGGYGLKGDMILGLVGSIVGSWIFRTMGVSLEAGMVVLVIVAFVGAAIPIVAQRKIWPALA
ncbi:MAG: hypothetical protein AUH81_07435 [Candidatus Rokubacteria bacterium 13_1_40CM_4_69_5]|nr:MAG: hypothetical protein AUH81_07435 [Candidatus Rokubacteria bacterium 13_1_40CM_4_69_5]